MKKKQNFFFVSGELKNLFVLAEVYRVVRASRINTWIGTVVIFLRIRCDVTWQSNNTHENRKKKNCNKTSRPWSRNYTF